MFSLCLATPSVTVFFGFIELLFGKGEHLLKALKALKASGCCFVTLDHRGHDVGPLTMDPAVPVTPALEARVIQVQAVPGFLVREYADSGPPSLCGS